MKKNHPEIDYQTLFNSCSDAVMLLNKEGFFECNRMTLDIFGCSTKEEFLTKQPGDLSPVTQPDGSDSKTAANEKIKTSLEKGNSSRFDWMYKRLDNGKEVLAEVILDPIEIEGEKILRVTVRDITERKKFEKELLARDNLLLALAKASDELVRNLNFDEAVSKALSTIGLATNVDRVYIFKNHKKPETDSYLTSQIYEWVRDGIFPEIDNLELQDLSFEFMGCLVNVLLQNKPVFGITRELDTPLREMLKSQKIKSLMLFPIFIEGHFWGFVGFDDCTIERTWTEAEQSILSTFTVSLSGLIERKKKGEREKEERLTAILNNIKDSVLTVSVDGTIESCNLAVEQMFRYKPAELIGKHLCTLFKTPKDPCNKVFMVGDCCLNDCEKKCNMRGKTKDGKAFPLEADTGEIYVSGTLTYLIVMRDISASMEAEKLRKLEQLKNEFISTVNHELRTPLTSLQGSLGLILSNAFGEIPDKARELLNIATNNCSRLISLINDILDIEKIEAGKMDFNYKIYEIMPIIQEAVEQNHSLIEKCKISVKIEKKDIENADVFVDKNRLMQVLTNLISNAIKFSPEGDEVKIIVSKTDKKVRVAVSDNGPGISKGGRSRIFEKFSQLDSSDSRSKGGTGLGLSICKAIIEKLNGRINLESEPGKGSVFYFDLPDYSGQDRKVLQYSEKPCILVCEDDQDVASLIQILLKNRLGCEVHIAKNAQETLEFLSLYKYNIITLDLLLPDVDANYMLDYLGKNEATKQVSIIVVSMTPPQDYSKALLSKCKIVDWIEKPINHERLVNTVKTILETDNFKEVKA